MPIAKITIAQAIELLPNSLCFDVRSPSEYAHAHIPNAINLVLFTNEERKIIGTAYKHESRQQAIKIGLKYFGPKMVKLVNQVEETVQLAPDKTIIVHCWRGGMRSAAIAWLLDLYGFKVNLLIGGYKTYRTWVLEQFCYKYVVKILAGNTGSNKTYWLNYMQSKGQSIIDLEALANHKGSSFGHLGMPAQPTQEQFENNLAYELWQNQANDIWIEDESKRIGNLNIPTAFWDTMRQAPVFYLYVAFNIRLQNILNHYGQYSVTEIIEAIQRISKRLGGLETKNAIAFAEGGDLKNCFNILLLYYDKYYQQGLAKRPNYLTLIQEITEDFFESM